MSYSQRYRTPSPLFPRPSPTTLERLIASWERLRELDIEGYRTSSAQPMSTWLVDIEWADGRSVRSPGRGTTCSPFTTQAVAMAYSPTVEEPLRPQLADGRPLSFLFSRATNGTLGPAARALMERHDMTMADNEWPRPVIFFNLGYAIEPTELRRGDAVHIDWMNGGGHAVFCWDVHLNQQGEVDAFQYVSSNGRIHVGDTTAGAGLGVSVGGTPAGPHGYISQSSAVPLRYEVLRSPLFVDDERYVAESAWVTWNPRLKISDLQGCRVTPRGKLAYARVVKAARFHGVVAPPPFAMSARATDGPGLQATAVASAAAASADEGDPQTRLRVLQKQLQLLFVAGFIGVDPGELDGRLGEQTTAAVRAFQTEYQLTVDGRPGPRTRAKLAEVYAAACLAPPAKEYLATGVVKRSPALSETVAFSAGPTPPLLRDFYFRHGGTWAGEEVELILDAEGLDRLPLDLCLRDLDSGASHAVPTQLLCAAGQGRVRLRIPIELGSWPPRRLIVAIPSLGIETAIPLQVASRA